MTVPTFDEQGFVARSAYNVVYTTMFGSHLYGTNTPTSDTDYKHVYLPRLDDMLRGVPLSAKVKKTNKAENTRNSPTDIDSELIPLQVFAQHFLEGQTYALELAFSVEGSHASQTVYDQKFVPFVKELRERFLTSNIKSMVGYAVNQASIYSFKGERLNVVREFKKFLLDAKEDGCSMDLARLSSYDQNQGMRTFVAELEKKYPKYFKLTTYDIGGERMEPCFTLLEKTLPFTSTFAHTLGVVEALERKYGSRADAASTDNVDWKAMMHALRIVDEGVELLSTRRLVLPVPHERAAELLAIKRGERDIEALRAELSQKVDYLKTLELQSDLPKDSPELRSSFADFMSHWLRVWYGIGFTVDTAVFTQDELDLQVGADVSFHELLVLQAWRESAK